MQQQSVIHDPRTATRPSERLFAARRDVARQRMARAAELFVTFSAPPIAPPEPTLPPLPNTALQLANNLIDGGSRVVSEVERIQRAVLEHFPSVSMNDLKSARRFKLIVMARQIGMYLAKTGTSQSYPEIGRRFGGRDHTTALHAFRKINRLIKTDPDLAKLVDSIRTRLEEVAQ